MIGYLIRLAFGGNFISRWNNFPRVEEISETGNLGMVLHTCMILSYLLEKKGYQKINKDYIFKRIFFSSFITFVLSDINSDVKNRIKQKKPYVFDRLEKKVYDLLLNWDMPEKIKSDIEFVFNVDKGLFGDHYEMEEKIIGFSKLFVAREEAYHNSIVYKRVYKKVLSDIDKRLASKEYKIFQDVIDNDVRDYLSSLRRLLFLYRWNRLRRNYSFSVMSHMFLVSFIAYIIGVLEGKDEKELEEMMCIGLYHDISEAITGDIVAPVKKTVPGFDELLDEIEEELVEEYLIGRFSGTEFYGNIRERIISPFDSQIGSLVKISDIFSALFEARIEGTHNSEFDKIYRRIKRDLNHKGYYSVDYLLKFGVDYFDLDLEDFLNL